MLGKSKATSAIDAARTRSSVLYNLRKEQDEAASKNPEWTPYVMGDENDTTESGLHAVDSGLLPQGKDVTWLEKITAQVSSALSGRVDDGLTSE